MGVRIFMEKSLADSGKMRNFAQKFGDDMMTRRYPIGMLMALGLMFGLLAGCKQVRTVSEDEGTDEEPTTEEVSELSPEEEIEELISEEPLPSTAEELFDDFFFNFAANKRLQLERISFPLRVHSAAKEDTLQREDWQTEHFFIHQEEYTIIFDNQEQMEMAKDTSLTNIVVEKIFLDQSFVQQYLFSREHGRWMLDEIRNQTLSLNANASFLAFYRQFVADSTFRHNSLNDEIVFSGPDPDDDFKQMEGVITPDFWEAFAPELPGDTIYNIVYGQQHADSNEKILVLRGIANGEEMELTFRRDGKRWKLTKLLE